MLLLATLTLFQQSDNKIIPMACFYGNCPYNCRSSPGCSCPKPCRLSKDQKQGGSRCFHGMVTSWIFNITAPIITSDCRSGKQSTITTTTTGGFFPAFTTLSDKYPQLCTIRSCICCQEVYTLDYAHALPRRRLIQTYCGCLKICSC